MTADRLVADLCEDRVHHPEQADGDRHRHPRDLHPVERGGEAWPGAPDPQAERHRTEDPGRQEAVEEREAATSWRGAPRYRHRLGRAVLSGRTIPGIGARPESGCIMPRMGLVGIGWPMAGMPPICPPIICWCMCSCIIRCSATSALITSAIALTRASPVVVFIRATALSSLAFIESIIFMSICIPAAGGPILAAGAGCCAASGAATVRVATSAAPNPEVRMVSSEVQVTTRPGCRPAVRWNLPGRTPAGTAPCAPAPPAPGARRPGRR